ncbi:hypothetical protein LDENG_00043250 [Lucifuga dentata]|nr:hypothetical protein LDENG_00043250 [Lucifuga dentata]
MTTSAKFQSRRSPKEQHNTAGQNHHNIYTKAQECVAPVRRTDPAAQMFPLKPVHHRRTDTLKRKESLDPCEIEKVNMTTQPRGHLLSQECHSNGIRAAGSQKPKGDIHRLPNRQEQMTNAIHSKELMLQEKLQRVEEKLRQKIQSDRGREMSVQEDNKQGKDRGQEESGEMNRWGRENVKEQSRGKEGDEKDDRTRGETRMRSQEKEAAKEKVQNKTPTKDLDWAREKKSKEMCSSNGDEREDMPKKSQKAAHRPTETHGGTGRKSSAEPSLPTVSLQEGLTDGTGSFQLLPCSICNRKFASERLENHIQICEKLKNSHRKVFNSFANRTKGTELEHFLKTHTRSETPEKNSSRLNQKATVRNLHQSQRPPGTTEPKGSIQAGAKQVTCPHCSRRFAPGPAERHMSNLDKTHMRKDS